ncbi:MAG: hypothetical protein HY554_03660 [Elusimicrobia bacterium]|nr:hypothetical protein [Elusimicrobiota bacterium]
MKRARRVYENRRRTLWPLWLLLAFAVLALFIRARRPRGAPQAPAAVADAAAAPSPASSPASFFPQPPAGGRAHADEAPQAAGSPLAGPEPLPEAALSSRPGAPVAGRLPSADGGSAVARAPSGRPSAPPPRPPAGPGRSRHASIAFYRVFAAPELEAIARERVRGATLKQACARTGLEGRCAQASRACGTDAECGAWLVAAMSRGFGGRRAERGPATPPGRPGAHSVTALAAVMDPGKSRAVDGDQRSFYARLAPGERMALQWHCEGQFLEASHRPCDVAGACASAGIFDRCEAACLEAPSCRAMLQGRRTSAPQANECEAGTLVRETQTRACYRAEGGPLDRAGATGGTFLSGVGADPEVCGRSRGGFLGFYNTCARDLACGEDDADMSCTVAIRCCR